MPFSAPPHAREATDTGSVKDEGEPVMIVGYVLGWWCAVSVVTVAVWSVVVTVYKRRALRGFGL